MFVELVTGREPIGHGPTAQLARIASDPHRRPTPVTLGAQVSDAVEQVLARALAVYPAERWQTAGSFWAALREAMADPCDEPPPPPSSSSNGRAPRLAPAAALAAIALALAASALADSGARPIASAGPVGPVASSVR
jgi:hypothetical protein